MIQRVRGGAARGRRFAVVPVAGVLVAAAVGLTGCVGSGPVPPAQQATPAEEDGAASPELVPGGSADENRPFFDAVNAATAASEPGIDGRAYVDALVEAGFERDAMQVTPDGTSIGREADGLTVAVRVGDGCLLGRTDAANRYTSAVEPVAPGGGCLVGATRPIDWEQHG